MPAPDHLVPILARLGDGGNVTTAQVVYDMVEEAKAAVRAELSPATVDTADSSRAAVEEAVDVDLGAAEPAADETTEGDSADDDWDDSGLDEFHPDTTSNPAPKPVLSSSEYREWARANDVPCPARGAIPQSVKDAYQAARDA